MPPSFSAGRGCDGAAARELDPMVPLGPDEWRALVEQAPVMVWRGGPDGARDYFNARWLAFTGRGLAQEIGEGWLEGVHPDDLGECVATIRDRMQRRLPFERQWRLRRHDGVYRAVVERAVPYTGADGAFAGFVGASVDVEDRLASGPLSKADEFFEMSLDNLCVTGFDGYFKRVNPSWTRTLGWSEEELLSRPVEDLMHPEDRARTLAARSRLHVGADMGPLVNRYRCKDGTYRWFEWRSIGHPERGLVYAAARDVTETREAEERLFEAKEREEKLQRQLMFADRMASVGTLAAGVAHEINNPLSYVMVNIALLLEELKSLDAASFREHRAALEEMARDAQTGAERIRKIVRGLKTFSRAEPERRGAVDVRSVLEQSITMVFNEIRHRARLVKDYGETPLIEADDARLGQVFINLLINAAQAIPETGADDNEIRVVTSTDEMGRAVIEVRDTGPGIAPDLVDRIFDPFFTTKPVGVGTGLGLSICHTIVTGLGGEIGVVSTEGRGATFRVVLPPATPSATQDERAAARPPEPPLACASILVVDDEPAVGAVLKRVLRDHAVTAVTTAKEALELLREGRRFDVIFSDLMMPEMSGMELYDELVRRFPDAAKRVVFVSGGAFTPAAEAFLARVTAPKLDKPFDPRVVREIVQRFIA